MAGRGMQRVWIETENDNQAQFARCENVGAKGLTSVGCLTAHSDSMRTRQQVWTDVDGRRVDDQPIVFRRGPSASPCTSRGSTWRPCTPCVGTTIFPWWYTNSFEKIIVKQYA